MVAFDYKVNAIVERIDKTNEILSEMTVESPFDESTVNSTSSDSTKAQ